MSWSILEISVPREVFQTPKAIESIFSTLHSMSSPPEFMEKYWKGKVQDYMCFEMVGNAGKSHIYVRAPSNLKGYVTSQIYAQYPKAEIKEVNDYTLESPINAPNANYDLWGTEMMLAKEDGYPIKTYVEFEETIEEKRLDPVSSLLESFAQLRDGEQIWIQMLIKPTARKWEQDGQKLIDKLVGKKITVKKTGLQKSLDLFTDALASILGGGAGKPSEKKDSPLTQMQHLTPGQKEVVEAIEKNIAKLGFDTAIRVIYISKRELFNRANISAIIGFFKQFNTLNLNGFKPNAKISPKIKYPPFKKEREHVRKRNVYINYRMRMPPKIPFVFNTEELATIFHFPSTVVEAPSTPRIEAKKSEPPANLPI